MLHVTAVAAYGLSQMLYFKASAESEMLNFAAFGSYIFLRACFWIVVLLISTLIDSPPFG